MKIYIATSLQLYSSLPILSWALRERGHEIASTWHEIPADTEESLAEESLTDEQRHTIAERNYADIRCADAMLYIDHPACRNAFAEVGYAYGRRIQVYGVIGSSTGRPPIQVEHAVRYWFDSVSEGLFATLAAQAPSRQGWLAIRRSGW